MIKKVIAGVIISACLICKCDGRCFSTAVSARGGGRGQQCMLNWGSRPKKVDNHCSKWPLSREERRVCEFVIEKRILVISHFLKISLEKRGHLIIRVILYLGQYGISWFRLQRMFPLTSLLPDPYLMCLSPLTHNKCTGPVSK